MLTLYFYRLLATPRHLASAFVWAWVVVLMPGHAHASCDSMVPVSSLEEVIAEAEAALSRLDVDGFKDDVGRLERMLPCTASIVPARVAAGIHRLVGIRATGNRDPLAPRAFAAARWIEPNYRFSRALIPDGNPIRRVYDEAPWQERATDPVPRPETGAIVVDGVSADRVALSWPALVQWVDASEQVRFTTYRLPGTPLPDYPEWDPSTAESPQAPPVLVGLAIGTGVASGVMYGIATAQEARFKDTSNNPVPDESLPDLRRSTNNLVLGSIIAGTASVGMGITVIAAW